MAHHIFPKAEMTSNKPLHNKRYHFVVYFLTPFPSDKMILFAVKDVMSHNDGPIKLKSQRLVFRLSCNYYSRSGDPRLTLSSHEGSLDL